MSDEQKTGIAALGLHGATIAGWVPVISALGGVESVKAFLPPWGWAAIAIMLISTQVVMPSVISAVKQIKAAKQ